ncbi:carbohydrate ABC transporter permease [Microbacterium sp. NIBRBAC000506063]|uniref:carbohydrate ABC transporter permease n=1 Tax=Microbacterium sp. NIBRBAC000506063 TaxID=2734618 RepID=UPI001BB66E8C|nr:carbohydrate ABC transporter permease [Microbacterium sp. NIBRBAC000506063]QTV79327.1 carbohydrate ABC transporter permease [Microbacterium sp. NIBRBAC000506063]
MNRYTWRTGILEALMILVGLAIAFPVYIMVNISLRRTNDQTSPLVPSPDMTFENYTRAWGSAGLSQALLNSLFITVVSVAILVVFSAMAAYALVRVTSRLSTPLFYFFLIGLLLPFQIAMIPLYFTMRDIGLLGSLWGLILFYVGERISFSIFLFAGFIRALPRDYEEAAWIDGASTNRAFWTVVFPLLRPITWTVVILNAIHAWNDLLTPMLYLSGTPNVTVPVAILRFVDQYVTNWPLIFAGLVIGVTPILLAFFLLQRSVIKGFASGLKG